MKKSVCIFIVLALVFSVSSCADTGKSRFEFSDVSIKDMYETSEPISTSFMASSKYYYARSLPSAPPGIVYELDMTAEHSVMPIDNVEVTLYFSFAFREQLAYVPRYCINAYDGETGVKVADHTDGPYHRKDFGHSIDENGRISYDHSESVVIPPEFFAKGFGIIMFSFYIPDSYVLTRKELHSTRLYYKSDGESVMITEGNPEFGSAWVKPLYIDTFSIPNEMKTEYDDRYSIKSSYGKFIPYDIECFDVIDFEKKAGSAAGESGEKNISYRIAACSRNNFGKLTVKLPSYYPESGKLYYWNIVSLNYSGEYSIEMYTNAKTNKRDNKLGFHLYLWDDGVVLSFDTFQEVRLSMVGKIMDIKENGELRDSMLGAALSPKSVSGYTFTPEKTIFGFSKFAIQKSEDQ